MKIRDPKTREEWQEAVDLAEGLLALESARAYGFVAGGPSVDVARCEEVLRRGRDRGFTPHDNAIELVALALADQAKAEVLR